MFGLITSLLNIIVSITPQAIADRRKARERELGAWLFQICLTVHGIADRGDKIVYTLKMARSVMNSTRPRTKEEWWTKRLKHLVEAQHRAFRRLETAIVRYGMCLAALDPDAYSVLAGALTSKRAIIYSLQDLFEDHKFPLEAPGGLSIEPGSMTIDYAVISLSKLLYSMPPLGAEVDVTAELDETTVAAIEAYLTELNPERNLAEIREKLKTLRAVLDETFKLSEILLELASLDIGI